MIEHEKLRSRLKNVGRGVTEYRMTVEEAKSLLAEFDTLNTKSVTKPIETLPTEPPKVVILDGGSF